MALVQEIMRLITKDWRIEINHVLREGNRCADFLANHAQSLSIDIVNIPNLPVSILELLLQDIIGISSSRT